ncbi:Beta-barrel assembly-enhancing protease [Candidatus Magnetaquicoccaceae bacterium FCR-1]|uniref:Beta-barrel assembly-enhancing protease n=1 Tax=Candidatus Magnetaquiglobus chichijimensis TaxID=3141448 RepID=A0ABQ0C5Z3_9PROT
MMRRLVGGKRGVRWLSLFSGLVMSGCVAVGPVNGTPTASAEVPKDEKNQSDSVGAAGTSQTPSPEKPSADGVYYYYVLGHMMMGDRRWEEAENAFVRVAEGDPKSVEARLIVSHLATQRGELNVAARYAQEAVALDADNVKARLLLAGLLNALERYPESASHYEALIKKQPDHLSARLMLAQIYGRLKDPARAKGALAPLFAKSDVAWKANLAMGRAYVHMNDLKKSLEYFRKARKQAPDQLEPILALGAALQEMDRPKEAETIYREFLSRNPESETIHSRLGRLLLTQEDRAAALEEFRTIARLSPGSVQARLTSALILMSQRHFEDALQELRLADAVRPGNSGVAYYIGQTLEALDRLRDARNAYESIKQDDPFYLEAQVRIAFLDASEKKGKEAASRLKSLNDAYPDRIEVLLALTVILFQEEEYDAVVDTASKGLHLAPDQSRFLFNRAMALDKLQRWPEAEQDLQQYLGKNPDDAHALNYLGYTWAERNEKLEEAHKLIIRASQLAPGDGFILDSLGWVLYRMNRLDEALTRMREAVRMEPKDPTIREHLGDVLAASGRIKEALTVWRQSLELNSANDALRAKIDRHVQEGHGSTKSSDAPGGTRPDLSGNGATR